MLDTKPRIVAAQLTLHYSMRLRAGVRRLDPIYYGGIPFRTSTNNKASRPSGLPANPPCINVGVSFCFPSLETFRDEHLHYTGRWFQIINASLQLAPTANELRRSVWEKVLRLPSGTQNASRIHFQILLEFPIQHPGTCHLHPSIGLVCLFLPCSSFMNPIFETSRSPPMQFCAGNGVLPTGISRLTGIATFICLEAETFPNGCGRLVACRPVQRPIQHTGLSYSRDRHGHDLVSKGLARLKPSLIGFNDLT